MTKEELAAILNDREYGAEITEIEAKLAKKDGLVVVFGHSDDCVEFRGAIEDEAYGDSILVSKDGIYQRICEDCDDCKLNKAHEAGMKKIKAKFWNNPGGFSWLMSCDFPASPFVIMEDGEKFCRGLVFDIKELG